MIKCQDHGLEKSVKCLIGMLLGIYSCLMLNRPEWNESKKKKNGAIRLVDFSYLSSELI